MVQTLSEVHSSFPTLNHHSPPFSAPNTPKSSPSLYTCSSFLFFDLRLPAVPPASRPRLYAKTFSSTASPGFAVHPFFHSYNSYLRLSPMHGLSCICNIIHPLSISSSHSPVARTTHNTYIPSIFWSPSNFLRQERIIFNSSPTDCHSLPLLTIVIFRRKWFIPIEKLEHCTTTYVCKCVRIIPDQYAALYDVYVTLATFAVCVCDRTVKDKIDK